jgi:hypothetical protein
VCKHELETFFEELETFFEENVAVDFSSEKAFMRSSRQTSCLWIFSVK